MKIYNVIKKDINKKYREYNLNTHIVRIINNNPNFNEKFRKYFKKNNFLFKDYIHTNGKYIIYENPIKEKLVEYEIKEKLRNIKY